MSKIDPRELVKNLREFYVCDHTDLLQAAKVVETLVEEVERTRRATPRANCASKYNYIAVRDCPSTGAFGGPLIDEMFAAREATNTLLKLES